jgi:hypothetical protein
MSNEEILSRLSQLIIDPSDVVFSITSRTILSAIVQRMGIQALALSSEDLQLAKEEVREAINHL